jgi:hypothetical protein
MTTVNDITTIIITKIYSNNLNSHMHIKTLITMLYVLRVRTTP